VVDRVSSGRLSEASHFDHASDLVVPSFLYHIVLGIAVVEFVASCVLACNGRAPCRATTFTFFAGYAFRNVLDVEIALQGNIYVDNVNGAVLATVRNAGCLPRALSACWCPSQRSNSESLSRVQDWQNKCLKLFINQDVVDEWSRVATEMNDIGKSGKVRSGGEDASTEMMALLETELKTVHDVMGKKWRYAFS
jgi:hypothetical protein